MTDSDSAEATSNQMASQLVALEKRIADIENKAADSKKPWYRSWQEIIKSIGLPFGVIVATLGFYDTVYLRWEKQAAEAARNARDKLTKLEDMSAEVYRLNAMGQSQGAQALLEARKGLRQRLNAELYEFYLERPDFLYTWEKQTLSNDLLSQGRTGAAIKLADDIVGEMNTTTDKADIQLFRGRILGADGPAKDLEGARAAMKNALTLAEQLRDYERDTMWAKISATWLFIEQSNYTPCEKSENLYDILTELTVKSENPVDLGVLNTQVGQMIAIHKNRCSK